MELQISSSVVMAQEPLNMLLFAQLSCPFHFEGSGAGRCNIRCSSPMGFKRANIVRRQWDSFC